MNTLRDKDSESGLSGLATRKVFAISMHLAPAEPLSEARLLIFFFFCFYTTAEYVCTREGHHKPSPPKIVASQCRTSAGSKRMGCRFKVNLRNKTPEICCRSCSPSSCQDGHIRQVWRISMVKLHHNHELERPNIQYTLLTANMKALLDGVAMSAKKTTC